jgi:hypothetical protein
MFYMTQAVSPPVIRSSKTVHSIGYMSSLLAATALDIYPMLCVQFFALLMTGGKSPETCRALRIIKNIV